MKKLLIIIFFGLFSSGNSYAEEIKKIHFICSFDKFINIVGFFEEVPKPKDELPTVITNDEFLILEIKPNDDIRVLETSFWIISSTFEPEERIIIPSEINDKEIVFKIPIKSDKVSQVVTLNRRSGKLEFAFKSPVDKGKIYYSCSVKEKLF